MAIFSDPEKQKNSVNTLKAGEKNLRTSAPKMDGFTGKAVVTLFATVCLGLYLLPFSFMFLTSVKTPEQIIKAEYIIPQSPRTIDYENPKSRNLRIYEVIMPDGDTRELALLNKNDLIFVDPDEPEELIFWDPDDVEEVNSLSALERTGDTIEYNDIEQLSLFDVPMPDGETKELALLELRRKGDSKFIDPDSGDEVLWNPDDVDGIDNVAELEPNNVTDLHFENYLEVLDRLAFFKLFRNTAIIAVLGIIGTVLSCSAVAYGFTRFPIPYKNVLFLLLIGTILLPKQVTLIPTYFIFQELKWTGTWLPLIVPHFFANAYNVFLLRQYFLTIPKDLDEAAYMDGATSLQVLSKIIIPQSLPAIVAVSLFHLIFAWNDYFEPLIYLGGNAELAPLALGFGQFTFNYATRYDLLMAASLLALAVPVLLFFAAQRFFMQGVVFTGVK